MQEGIMARFDPLHPHNLVDIDKGHDRNNYYYYADGYRPLYGQNLSFKN
jgi:hypothetical protein